ncbi:MAG: hypothetical protein FJ267_14110, partial [Planctomycetes bacterium]|nr:hypothetical protein [Planctomycetota bacterium]
MPFEIECGECHRLMRVEAFGSVVACPHCGIHLQIEDPNEASSSETASDTDSVESSNPTTDSITTSGMPNSIDIRIDPGTTQSNRTSKPKPTSSSAEEVTKKSGKGNSGKGSNPLRIDSQKNGTPKESASATPKRTTTSTTVNSSKSLLANPLLLIVVGTYASVVTILLIYQYLFSRQHALESLPDLVPPIQNGSVGWIGVKPEHEAAPGHKLVLGQSQRFGNIRVTPLKVTRSPLTFEHYLGEKSAAREPSQPVLKLWLKFENVSTNQSVAPLDRTLLFKRRYDADGNGGIFSYGFIGMKSNRTSGRGGDGGVG